MKEVSQERAHELDAAWKAASELERLTMNRMSWFGSDKMTYYEEEPSRLERMAAARIAELETTVRRFADDELWGHDGHWHQWHGADDPKEFARKALAPITTPTKPG